MQRIKTFDHFVNEELSLGKAALGLGLAASLAMSPAKSQVNRDVEKTTTFTKTTSNSNVDLNTVKNILKKKGFNFVNNPKPGINVPNKRPTSSNGESFGEMIFYATKEIGGTQYEAFAVKLSNYEGDIDIFIKESSSSGYFTIKINLIEGHDGKYFVDINGKPSTKMTPEQVIKLLNEFGVAIYK
jgi:hypothetical protein